MGSKQPPIARPGAGFIPSGRMIRRWRVSLPGREPFNVICVQGATAAEIRRIWPGAQLKVMGRDG